ncbi:7407_t:CDS:1, partial [Acaulospora colombiana]
NEVMSSFVPVLKSLRQEHRKMRTCVLSKSRTIMDLVRVCENLSSVRVYGWNLTDSDIQEFPQHCPTLKEFHVIGINKSLTRTSINSIIRSVSELRVLDLDGAFDLPDSFAETLTKRHRNLNSLKLCTESMTANGFSILASRLGRLTELTLQNCSGLTDNNVFQFADTNPNLKVISISGDVLSIESLKAACTLKELCHLDLRCTSQACGSSPDDRFMTPLGGNLRTMLLENLPLNDGMIENMFINCKQLEVFGLSRCSLVTYHSIEIISRASRNLRVLNVTRCPYITDKCLRFLVKYSRHTLTEFIVESCGKFDPKGVHWLACNTNNLERMAFHDTDTILRSFVYHQFAGERHDPNGSLRCTIEGENLKKLIHYDIDQEEDLVISKSKIPELAVELNLPFDVLESAIKKVLGKGCSSTSATLRKNLGDFDRRDSLNSSHSGSPRRESRDADFDETGSLASRCSSYSTPAELSSPIKKTQSGWSSINIKITRSNQRLSFDSKREDQPSSSVSVTQNADKPDSPPVPAQEKATFDKEKYEVDRTTIHESPLPTTVEHRQFVESPVQEASRDETILKSPMSEFSMEASTSRDSEQDDLQKNIHAQISSSPEPLYNEITKKTLGDEEETIPSERSADDPSAWDNENEQSESLSWNDDNLDTSRDLGGWGEMESDQIIPHKYKWAGDHWTSEHSEDRSQDEIMESTGYVNTSFVRNSSEASYSRSRSSSLQRDHREWPTPSEAAALSPKKHEAGDHSARNVDFASPWGSHKKWSTDAEKKQPEQPNPTWDPNELKNANSPIYFEEKKLPVNKNKDDNGWGPPPSNDIPWDDERQGVCLELIQEQKRSIYWAVQQGQWVKLTGDEETETSEKETVETRSQRFENQNQTSERWNEIRDCARRDRDRGFEREDNASTIKKGEIAQCYNASISNAGDARERMGNPQWKSENEWRHKGNEQNPLSKPGRESGDLINPDIPDISDSKSTSDDSEEILSVSSNKDYGEYSIFDSKDSVNLPRKEIDIDLSDQLNDSEFARGRRFVENVMISNPTERDIKRGSIERNDNLLIDLESDQNVETSSNSNPGFSGKVNQDIAGLSDFYCNPESS